MLHSHARKNDLRRVEAALKLLKLKNVEDQKMNALQISQH